MENKITREHLKRKAYIYVRQSTMEQVLTKKESQRERSHGKSRVLTHLLICLTPLSMRALTFTDARNVVLKLRKGESISEKG